MPRDPQADLAGAEAWLATVWERFPPLHPPVRVTWARNGLMAIHERLEHLKADSVHWDQLLSESGSHGAIARGWVRLTTEQYEDAWGAQVSTGRGTRMVSQGMAWEERRVSYQTGLIDQVSWVRRWTKVAEEVEAVASEARNRHFSNRAERTDLHTQSRLISVAMELGEL